MVYHILMLQYDDDVNVTEFRMFKEEDFPANIYLFKANNRNTKIDALELLKSQMFFVSQTMIRAKLRKLVNLIYMCLFFFTLPPPSSLKVGLAVLDLSAWKEWIRISFLKCLGRISFENVFNIIFFLENQEIRKKFWTNNFTCFHILNI